MPRLSHFHSTDGKHIKQDVVLPDELALGKLLREYVPVWCVSAPVRGGLEQRMGMPSTRYKRINFYSQSFSLRIGFLYLSLYLSASVRLKCPMSARGCFSI